MYRPLSRWQVLILFCLYILGYEVALPYILSASIYPNYGMQAYLLCTQLSEALILVLFVITALPWLMRSWQRFKAKLNNNLSVVLTMTLGMLAAAVLVNLLVFSFFGMGEAENQVNNNAIAQLDQAGFLFSAVIFAPFAEEMLFRGCIFHPLRNRYGFMAGALVSAFLFGFVHIIATIQAGNWINLLYILEYGLCGFFLCMTMEKTNSIFGSILMHSMYNLIILIFL